MPPFIETSYMGGAWIEVPQFDLYQYFGSPRAGEQL